MRLRSLFGPNPSVTSAQQRRFEDCDAVHALPAGAALPALAWLSMGSRSTICAASLAADASSLAAGEQHLPATAAGEQHLPATGRRR